MPKSAEVTIEAPHFETAVFRIKGIVPYVQNAFSKKAQDQIHGTQAAGSVAKKGKKRDPKDFQACYQQAQHRSPEGWHGLPASGIRAAMVSACRTVGFQMTKAKLGFFIEADDYDPVDRTPLVKITKGEPKYFESWVRNETGVVDLRARALWEPGWEAEVHIRFDADMFTLTDIANLLMRVGLQVGIGEGRPDSKNSTGMGWGLFEIAKEAKDESISA